MQVGHDSTKSCFSEITISNYFPQYGSFFVITYYTHDGALTPNSKMEILTLFPF